MSHRKAYSFAVVFLLLDVFDNPTLFRFPSERRAVAGDARRKAVAGTKKRKGAKIRVCIVG